MTVAAMATAVEAAMAMEMATVTAIIKMPTLMLTTARQQ
jgi:hypothetical protein